MDLWTNNMVWYINDSVYFPTCENCYNKLKNKVLINSKKGERGKFININKHKRNIWRADYCFFCDITDTLNTEINIVAVESKHIGKLESIEAKLKELEMNIKIGIETDIQNHESALNVLFNENKNLKYILHNLIPTVYNNALTESGCETKDSINAFELKAYVTKTPHSHNCPYCGRYNQSISLAQYNYKFDYYCSCCGRSYKKSDLYKKVSWSHACVNWCTFILKIINLWIYKEAINQFGIEESERLLGDNVI